MLYPLPHLNTANLQRVFEAEDVNAKWEATSWAKKRAAKAARANTTDFDRFKIMLARKKRRALIRKAKK